MPSIDESVIPLGHLVDVLRKGAQGNPDDVVYVFLRERDGRGGEEIEESLTHRGLDRAARARAALLQHSGLNDQHAVLVHPHGPEFIRAFAGCLYAGIAGAPVKFPSRRAELSHVASIAEAAGTTTVLTTQAGYSGLLARFPDAPELHELNWIATDTVEESLAESWTAPDITPDHLALLQFTSGSTGHPKGVMVSHHNFARQAELLEKVLEFDDESVVVSWLPFFHDFGLVFSVVVPLWLGVPAYLMSPSSFVGRPRRLLETVSRTRGTHVGSPNFGFDLCVRKAATDLDQLDLSSWRVALNGAEPVREATLRQFTETFKGAGFDPSVYSPAYGLAEATLVVSAKRPADLPRTVRVSSAALAEGRVALTSRTATDTTALVSSGPVLPGTVVRIVEPEGCTPCGADEIGEIWVQGPSVAQGYWRHPQDTEETFGARIAGHEADGTFLRTGDLGFLDRGELYVTGRRKDLIILQGHNYYPQDIEYVVESCHPSLTSGSAAAFAVERDGEERLAVVVEATGAVLKDTTPDLFAERVRDIIWSKCQLPASEVVIVRRGELAKTTSGKIQRRECRRRLESGEFDPRTLATLSAREQHPAADGPSADAPAAPLPTNLLKPMLRMLLSRIAGIPVADIADDQSFAEYGLSSLGAQQLAAVIEPVVGHPVSVDQVFNHPTVDQLTAVLGQTEGRA
ncbi:AMP-binding protein [Streptomyces sp. NPDC006539]|uniref:AMP-binding protein n=1 Tax=Streptomyces sp. NPDC006539 TaxID=3155352 RepID=UPI0033A6B787